MKSLFKYTLIYSLGIISASLAYIIFHIPPTLSITENNKTTHPTRLTPSNYLHLSEEQMQNISKRVSIEIKNQIAEVTLNTQAKVVDAPIITEKQVSMKEDLITQVDTGIFFSSGATIDDMIESEQMKQLSSDQQFQVLSKVFGKLNTGELQRSEVFGEKHLN